MKVPRFKRPYLSAPALGVRGKLITLVLVLLVPVVGLNAYSVYIRYDSQLTQELAESQVLAGAISTALINYLETLWSAEASIGAALVATEHHQDPEVMEAALRSELEALPTITVLTWVNPDGTVAASSRPGVRGMVVASQEYFQRVLDGRDKVVSDLMLSRIMDRPTVVAARAIRHNGHVEGILLAAIDVTRLDQVLPTMEKEGRRFGFLDTDGHVVYSSRAPDMPMDQRLPRPDFFARRSLSGETVLLRNIKESEDGAALIAVSVPVGALNWVYYSTVPHQQVLSDVWRHIIRDVVVLMVVAAGSLLLAGYIGRGILRPVLAVQEAARSITAGELSARVGLPGSDEVAAAARTFDSMAARVQLTDEVLRARVSAVALLSQQALSGADATDLTESASALTALSLGAEVAVVLELLPVSRRFRVRAGAGLPDTAAGLIVPEAYAQIGKQVMDQLEPLVVSDVGATLGKVLRVGARAVASAIVVPIAGRDHPYGVFVIGTMAPRRFQPSEVHFVQAVANVLATAVQRKSVQSEQAFLARAGTLLTASLDKRETLSTLTALVIEALGDCCMVDLVTRSNPMRLVRCADPAKAEIAARLENRPGAACGEWQRMVEVMEQGDGRLVTRITDEMLRTMTTDDVAYQLLRQLGAVSAMAVPLKARGRFLGFLVCMSADPDREYGQHDLELLRDLAEQAALAVDHARMYREATEALAERDQALALAEAGRQHLRVLARQQASVATLGQRLISGEDLDAVLAEGVIRVTRVLGVDACRILELQPDGAHFRVRAGTNWTGKDNVPVELRPGVYTLSGYALHSREPLIVRNLPRETRFASWPVLLEQGIISSVAVAIPGEDEPIGVLSAHCASDRTFSRDDVNFLMAVAHVVSRGIQHERDQRRLQTQYAVARILAESSGIAEAGRGILQALCHGWGWDVGMLWSVDRGAEAARLVEVWHGADIARGSFLAAQGYIPRRGEGLVGKAWAEAKPLWFSDVSLEVSFMRARAAAEIGLHGALLIPVKLGDEVSVIIECFSRQVRRPESAVIDMATTIGRQVGQLLQRQRAEEGLRRLNAELEERVAERTAELRAANRDLESFAYSVSHDLRAPLRTIDGFSQALDEDFGDQVGDSGQDYLRRIRSAARSMSRLIDDLLRLSRVMRQELRRERVNLSRLARAVVADLEGAQPDRQVSVTIEDGLFALGDEQLLRVVLQNLLGNAWKFTSRKPRAEIRFGALRENGKVVYYVQDNGAGFDMANADQLFVPFQRFHPASEFEGTGIGLATVQRVILRHGGRVWGEGQVDRGATIYFALGWRGEGLAGRVDSPGGG